MIEFSRLPVGALFKFLDDLEVCLMKTNRPGLAVSLRGVWIDGTLFPPGVVLEFSDAECVHLIDDMIPGVGLPMAG